MEKDRTLWTDSVKGIGILAIMLGHIAIGTDKSSRRFFYIVNDREQTLLAVAVCEEKSNMAQ